MFPIGSGLAGGCGATESGGSRDVLQVAREALAACVPAAGSAEMIEQVRVLEELRGLLSAVQASVTSAFVTARKCEQVAAGWPKRRVGVGIGQEVGLARRESPHKAGRYAGWAGILTSELPHTFAALRAGQISEWRAMIVARETGWLSLADRTAIDADLGPRLAGLGEAEIEAEARRLAYKLNPEGLAERAARAARYRHVTVRPALEGMSRLSALVPLKQGVAAFAALKEAADRARAVGDDRSRSQVMADTLVERVTGQATADGVPIMVDLIITDQALFGTGPDPRNPRPSPATDRYRPPSPATGSPAPPAPPQASPPSRPGHRACLHRRWWPLRRVRRWCGSADCSPTRSAGWSAWRPGAGSSPPRWPSSSGCGTSGAPRRTAGPLSATSTTPCPGTPAGRAA